MEVDFFGNELRGYRLLKAAVLSGMQRQQVLAQTKNRTDFPLVQNALRTLFAEELPQGRHTERTGRVWYADDGDEWLDGDEDAPNTAHEDIDWVSDNSWWDDYGAAAYWNDNDYEAEQYYDGWEYGYWAEPSTPTAQDLEEETRLARDEAEAFAIVGDANRTLTQACDAVHKARSARGFFLHSSMKGKSKGKSKGKRKSFYDKGKGTGSSPGKGTFSAGCFI